MGSSFLVVKADGEVQKNTIDHVYEKLKVLEDGMNTYLGEGNASVENNWNLGIAFCALCGAYNAHEEVLGMKFIVPEKFHMLFSWLKSVGYGKQLSMLMEMQLGVIIELVRDSNVAAPFLVIQHSRLQGCGALTHGEMYVETVVANVSNILLDPSLPTMYNSGIRVRPSKVYVINLGPFAKDAYFTFLILNAHKRITDLHLFGSVNIFTPRYSLIAQVYDESGTAWLKLPNFDVSKLMNEECHNIILTTEDPDSRVYPPHVLSLIGKHLLFLIERESAKGRCLRDFVNNHNAYTLGAKTIAQRSSIENNKTIITQPAPPAVLID
ncbi:hypothetical protein JHK85_010788 [Glycine max]|nr:hypothetical protein JHK85_010788 [Glycine max]KAG5066768.1 hypothetical protein JHK86_010499 [Glycine max]